MMLMMPNSTKRELGVRMLRNMVQLSNCFNNVSKQKLVFLISGMRKCRLGGGKEIWIFQTSCCAHVYALGVKVLYDTTIWTRYIKKYTEVISIALHSFQLVCNISLQLPTRVLAGTASTLLISSPWMNKFSLPQTVASAPKCLEKKRCAQQAGSLAWR